MSLPHKNHQSHDLCVIVNQLGDGLGCLDNLLDPTNHLDVHRHEIDAVCSTWCSENVWLPLHQYLTSSLKQWPIFSDHLHDILLFYLIYHVLHLENILYVVHLI